MNTRSPVTAITLTRVEGPIAACTTVTIDGRYTSSRLLTASMDPAYHGDPLRDRWTWAHELLTLWGRTAPRPGHGYDKVDVTVEWNNSSHWGLRFDLQQYGRDSSGHNLRQAYRHALTTYSGRARPQHMTTAQYSHFISEVVGETNMDRAAAILDTCDI